MVQINVTVLPICVNFILKCVRFSGKPVTREAETGQIYDFVLTEKCVTYTVGGQTARYQYTEAHYSPRKF